MEITRLSATTEMPLYLVHDQQNPRGVESHSMLRREEAKNGATEAAVQTDVATEERTDPPRQGSAGRILACTLATAC